MKPDRLDKPIEIELTQFPADSSHGALLLGEGYKIKEPGHIDKQFHPESMKESPQKRIGMILGGGALMALGAGLLVGAVAGFVGLIAALAITASPFLALVAPLVIFGTAGLVAAGGGSIFGGVVMMGFLEPEGAKNRHKFVEVLDEKYVEQFDEEFVEAVNENEGVATTQQLQQLGREYLEKGGKLASIVSKVTNSTELGKAQKERFLERFILTSEAFALPNPEHQKVSDVIGSKAFEKYLLTLGYKSEEISTMLDSDKERYLAEYFKYVEKGAQKQDLLFEFFSLEFDQAVKEANISQEILDGLPKEMHKAFRNDQAYLDHLQSQLVHELGLEGFTVFSEVKGRFQDFWRKEVERVQKDVDFIKEIKQSDLSKKDKNEFSHQFQQARASQIASLRPDSQPPPWVSEDNVFHSSTEELYSRWHDELNHAKDWISKKFNAEQLKREFPVFNDSNNAALLKQAQNSKASYFSRMAAINQAYMQDLKQKDHSATFENTTPWEAVVLRRQASQKYDIEQARVERCFHDLGNAMLDEIINT